jgi:hypothetical protein
MDSLKHKKKNMLKKGDDMHKFNQLYQTVLENLLIGDSHYPLAKFMVDFIQE